MLICRSNIARRCGNIRTDRAGNSRVLRFTILEPASPADVAELFCDNTFYFYDDVLKGKLPDTDNSKPVSLGITYNADLTCDIKIKLIKETV